MARGMPVHGSKKILVERLQSIRAAEQRSADELLSPRLPRPLCSALSAFPSMRALVCSPAMQLREHHLRQPVAHAAVHALVSPGAH